METARLLSTVLNVAAGHPAGVPRDASAHALVAAIDQLTGHGLLQHRAGAGDLQLSDAGRRLLDRIGRCRGVSPASVVWCWDGLDFREG